MRRMAGTALVMALLTAVGMTAVTPAGTGLGSATATAATAVDTRSIETGSARRHDVPVSTAVYDLGDQVFHDPRVTSYEKPFAPVPMELTAVVHYPTDLGSARHPMVVMEHGLWWACVNPHSGKPNGTWPCKPGSVPLPSFRGYDYLGRALAARGFVVVSISQNAINAHALGDAEAIGRAALVNEHLRMWQQFAATGDGPLAGAFVDPRTGTPVTPDFQGHVDTEDVGTLGHSRGGKGVLWQAADKHRRQWPAGVAVRAVLALAPAYDYGATEYPGTTAVTDIPLLIISATCDGAVGPDVGREYLHNLRGRNPHATTVAIAGGNHDFFNTRWSPGSVTGYDDAPRSCRDEIGAARQRHETTHLVVSFFDRWLGRS